MVTLRKHVAVVLGEKPLKTLLNSAPNSVEIHIATAKVTWMPSKWRKFTFAHCGPQKRAARFGVSALLWVTRPVTVHVQFNLGSNSCSCLRTMSRVCSEYVSFCLAHRTAAGPAPPLKMCEILHMDEKSARLI